jgi:hypothetical protein
MKLGVSEWKDSVMLSGDVLAWKCEGIPFTVIFFFKSEL